MPQRMSPDAVTRPDIEPRDGFGDALSAGADADDQRGLAAFEQRAKFRDQRRIMFAIGVERDRELEIHLQRFFEGAVERRFIARSARPNSDRIAPAASACAAVSSGEASSTTITGACRRAAATTAAIVAPSRKAGIRTAVRDLSTAVPSRFLADGELLPRISARRLGGTAPAGQGRSASRCSSASTVPGFNVSLCAQGAALDDDRFGSRCFRCA